MRKRNEVRLAVGRRSRRQYRTPVGYCQKVVQTLTKPQAREVGEAGSALVGPRIDEWVRWSA